MKRTLALLVALIMLTGVLTGCGEQAASNTTPVAVNEKAL